MDNARGFVSDTIETYTGVKPTKVSCPDEVKAEKGGTIVCTFEVDGVPGKITIKQNDTKGSISVSSMTGIISSAKLEALIQAQLQPPNPSYKVDCGARVHPSRPGDVRMCDVRLDQAVVARASATIKDEDNNVDLHIVPVDNAAEKTP